MTPDDLATGPEALVERLVADRPAAAAALALAELARQATIELHKLARAEANARRGQADWGAWAKLANAARTALLQTTTCRDAARELEPPTG
jgi:hypothetical protein